MAGLDISVLNDAQKLVKRHSISDSMETTEFRSAQELKILDDLARRNVGCNQVRKNNIYQNAMGMTTRRDKYNYDC